MVPVTWHADGTVDVFCDPCLAPLVVALNAGGQRTVASCCGHGRRPGAVALVDGRELIIAPDHETAREVCSRWPGINDEPVVTMNIQPLPEPPSPMAFVAEAFEAGRRAGR